MTWFDVLFSYGTIFVFSILAAEAYLWSQEAHENFIAALRLGCAVGLLLLAAIAASRVAAELIR